MDLKKQRIEIAVTGLILGIAGYLQYVAYHTKVRTNVQGMQSMTFPKIILYVMMLLCTVTLIKGIVNYGKLRKEAGKESEPAQKGRMLKIAATIVLIAVYAAMWNVIGFILSSLIFFFAESMLLDSSGSWKKAVVIAIVYTIVVYVVFGFCFGVSFPEPILEAILG